MSTDYKNKENSTDLCLHGDAFESIMTLSVALKNVFQRLKEIEGNLNQLLKALKCVWKGTLATFSKVLYSPQFICQANRTTFFST